MLERHGRSFLLLGAGILIGWGGSILSKKIGRDEQESQENTSSKSERGSRSSVIVSERKMGQKPQSREKTSQRNHQLQPGEINEVSERWKKMLLANDRAKVDEALKLIRSALIAGEDPDAWAAFQALAKAKEVNFDRSGLRELILPQLDQGSALRRKAAYWALYGIGVEKEDIIRVQNLKDDPEMRSAMTGFLRYMDPKGLSGASGDVVAEVIMEAKDPKQARQIIGGMWGGTLSKDLEKALLQMSRSEDSSLRYTSLYHGLSPVTPKSREVTGRLLEYLADVDYNTHSRAAWGLGYAVRPEDRGMVVEQVLELIGLRNPGPTQESLIKLTKGADSMQLPLIRETLQSGNLSDGVREKLEDLEQSLSVVE